MHVSSCSGLCREGYWCGEGSSSPTQHECGEGYPTIQGVLPTEVYCPVGASKPSAVSEGHYSVSASSFNSSLSMAERACEPGFWCHRGVKKECGGVSKYCPSSASKANIVPAGYFSVGGTGKTRQDIEVCPIGTVRIWK